MLLRALPPSAAGLAEALQLPPLTSQQPTRTLDLRASTSVDGAPDYESSQRAAARKAAAQRAAAGRRNPPPAAAAAAPGDASSLDGCIRLVAAAMAEVGGEAVSEDDDLFEVGLSSVTAAKLRQLLAERLAVDVPPDLVYRFTAVRSLAAALYRLRNDATAADDDGPQAAPLLVAAASRLYREGDIAGAVDRLEGLMPGSGAATRADAPALLLLLGAWRSTAQWRKAEAACAALLQEGVRPAGLDRALLWAALAHIRTALGDASGAAAATDAADDAARPVAATTTLTAAPSDDCVASLLAAPPVELSVDCAALQTLVLQGRALSVLPDAIGELSALKVLDASDNALTSLPAALGRCGELRELLLAANEFTDLPAWLADLPHLHVLNLRSATASQHSPPSSCVAHGSATCVGARSGRRPTRATRRRRARRQRARGLRRRPSRCSSSRRMGSARCRASTHVTSC